MSDVLVLGAGPAGSAASIALARRGVRVTLVDRARFPRDKVCGDALIPDALEVLDRLHLSVTLLADARRLSVLELYAPDGTCVSLKGRFACLPRRALDEALREAAVEAGAHFLAPFRAETPIVDDGRVVGARLVHGRTGTRVNEYARLTLLATGAARQPLDSFGLIERSQESAMAVRAYVTAEAHVAERLDRLCIAFDRAILPGYGWIFPGPGNTFNVGVGFFRDARRQPPTSNPRELFDLFVRRFPPAAALLGSARHVTSLKGAPLRTGLSGARLGRPGLLTIGEAAGLTYSLTGEGIGKAMASGLIAAEEVAAVLDGSRTSAAELPARYQARIRREFGARFRAYRRAQAWVSHEWFANFLARRARAGAYVRRELEGLINETSDPRTLCSAMGLVRALFG